MICILDAPILFDWQQVFEALHHPEFVRIDSRLEDIACRRRSMHFISPILLSSSMIEALHRCPRVLPKQLKIALCALFGHPLFLLVLCYLARTSRNTAYKNFTDIYFYQSTSVQILRVQHMVYAQLLLYWYILPFNPALISSISPTC